jgi:hypothetical protein
VKDEVEYKLKIGDTFMKRSGIRLKSIIEFTHNKVKLEHDA